MPSKQSTQPNDFAEALPGYHGKIGDRRQFLRDLCPCRNNNNKDVDTWRGIVHIARHGSLKERNSAGHAIRTLFDKAQKSAEWREVLKDVRTEIDDLMQDQRASRSLLGTMKKHGHAHQGAARQTYRRLGKILVSHTPSELADWLNFKLSLNTHDRVNASDPGVRRLAKWMSHRVKFQPKRSTKESEILAQAERFLPKLFA